MRIKDTTAIPELVAQIKAAAESRNLYATRCDSRRQFSLYTIDQQGRPDCMASEIRLSPPVLRPNFDNNVKHTVAKIIGNADWANSVEIPVI